MDPISFLILAGIFSVLACRTAGTAVTDAIAQSKGQTPPSMEKWRKRQQNRQARGEAVERDPGPWRRRWRMAAERNTAKAAQKHQARMDLLRDNGPANVAKHKEKLRRRADRWDRINATAARWGSASWDAAKDAASKAKDARDERRAWNENARRDNLDPVEPGTDQTSVDGPDADVLPFRRPGQPDDSSEGELRSDWDETDAEYVEMLRARAARHRANGDEETAKRYDQLASDYVADLQCPQSPTGWHERAKRETPQGTRYGCVHCGDGIEPDAESGKADSGASRASRPPLSLSGLDRAYVPEWSTEVNELWWQCEDGEISVEQRDARLADLAGIDRQLARELGITAGDLSDYSNHAEPPTEAELRERFSTVKALTPDDDGDATTGSEGAHDSGGGPATENTNEGKPTVTAPTHSGEITDLASGLAYVTTSRGYCSSIAGTFESAQAQADATAADLQRQLATLETAQATLGGEGLTAAAGQLGAVGEHFTTLAENMRQVTALLAATQESINAAMANLTSTETAFRSQMGITEQVQSHQEVATRTKFYANA